MPKTYFYERCRPQMIPPIEDGQIEEMLATLRPVLKDPAEEGRFREIITDGVDRRGESYIWSPALGAAVKIYRDGVETSTLATFHTYGYAGLFKPTLAEALGCIRAFVPDWREARYFWLNTAHMDGRHVVGSFHWCPCVLFGPERHNVIDHEWDRYRAKVEAEILKRAE